MSILKIYQGHVLKSALAEIIKPVQVTYVALDQPEPDTLQTLADLRKLIPYLSVNTCQEPVGEVDRVIIQSEGCPDLVFCGAPLGTELTALVSAIIVAGRGDSGLSVKTRRFLAKLCSPVHLELFTTPT